MKTKIEMEPIVSYENKVTGVLVSLSIPELKQLIDLVDEIAYSPPRPLNPADRFALSWKLQKALSFKHPRA